MEVNNVQNETDEVNYNEWMEVNDVQNETDEVILIINGWKSTTFRMRLMR
jgi:hypothetical protein